MPEAEPPSPEQLPALLEALLFVADGPVEEATLARGLGVTRRQVETALDALGASLGARGVRLQRGPEGAQLVTAPAAATYVEQFLGIEAGRRLSAAALETLAIIAYRQPVTRATIDAIRGVSSEGALATLRTRGLVEEAGRADTPGRPTLFTTTQRFLEHFGLERPDELPALPEDIAEAAARLPEQGAQLPLAPQPAPQLAAEARQPETHEAPPPHGAPDVEGEHDAEGLPMHTAQTPRDEVEDGGSAEFRLPGQPPVLPVHAVALPQVQGRLPRWVRNALPHTLVPRLGT